jgi:ubiquitin-like protein Pup
VTQEHKNKSAQKRTPEEQGHEAKDVRNEELASQTDATVADIDDVLEDQLDAELLADIDDVLEENAEEFVASYIQQGGE